MWRDNSEGLQAWELNVWIWLHNPDGIFAARNPNTLILLRIFRKDSVGIADLRCLVAAFYSLSCRLISASFDITWFSRFSEGIYVDECAAKN